MTSQPGGDISWDAVLAHRPPDTREAIRDRLVAAGVTPDRVAAALRDGGDGIFAAATAQDRGEDWAKPYGGPLAVALIAAEVGALTAHLTSRASAVRALAVEALLEDYSAVAVASRLGVSRQKVYDIARPGGTASFLDRTPWRP
ncbi:hypothetical protein COUCH_10945 [Couchioplanes caeruleus]|uniref:hypothetical protein n=1 Tax=Couchioplanes caeruleus TaxID=56438 RepID=UPI0020BE5584|nr:hypothetical protein [Couchioplanes caeruleus]UQU66741.1 hypothetical protein COUCH_10945 [Couchioplanes caeruleus]